MKKNMCARLSLENDNYLRQLAREEKAVYGSLSIVLNRILGDYRRKHGAKR